MGLLLSVLITCVGVIEAVTCYYKMVKGMIPEYQPGFDDLTRRYDDMFSKALALPTPRAEDWKRGGQGYLHLEGPRGALKASIKYAGVDQDTTSILFSTKISSFGQESIETDNPRTNESPERYDYENNEDTKESVHQDDRYVRKASPVSSFWDDDPEILEMETTSPPKEKIQWHYRPLTPTAAAELPAIHFNSYERKTGETEDQSGYSDEFLRSLDGVKFRPLQRDDGTGRRRSFKKRHSSSSTSSKESRASREEELKIFTSLEEDEFERVRNEERNSAPNLSADYNSKRRSRTRSKDRKSRSPAQSLSSDLPEEERRSPSSERRRLKDLPKVSSFEELPNEDEAPTNTSNDFALSQLTSDSTETNEEDGDSGVSFWDT